MIKDNNNQGANNFEQLLQLYLQRRKNLLTERVTNSHLDEDVLSAFFEGILSEREKTFVLRHLVDCSSCRRSTAEFAKAFENFDEAPQANLNQQTSEHRFKNFWESFKEQLFHPVDQTVNAYRETDDDKQVETEVKEEGLEEKKSAS